MRITLALILALFLALVVTIFAVQNNASVDIAFITWRTEGSLALVLMITFAVGILIGLLVSTPGTIKRRLQFSELKKQLQSLEKELEAAFKPSEASSVEIPTPEIPEDRPEGDALQESESDSGPQ